MKIVFNKPVYVASFVIPENTPVDYFWKKEHGHRFILTIGYMDKWYNIVVSKATVKEVYDENGNL